MNDGATPLLEAAQHGHEAVVQLLAEYKADVNQAMNGGATPLLFAAQRGHKKVAVKLLAAKADVDQADTGIGWSPLHAAAATGHRRMVRLLLQSRAYPTTRNKDGSTPLAAYTGQRKIAAMLLDKVVALYISKQSLLGLTNTQLRHCILTLQQILLLQSCRILGHTCLTPVCLV
jgi:ankyrin repeat protein